MKREKLSLNDYIELVERTDAPIGDSYSCLHEVHMAMGIVTEAGELIDVYKKNLAYGKAIDEVNLQEEIGDLMWYIARFVKIKGYDLEAIMATNIEKLKARYPEKFTSTDAINRDLKKEREILE